MGKRMGLEEHGAAEPAPDAADLPHALAALAAVRALEGPTAAEVARVLRQHALPSGRVLSKSELLRVHREMCRQEGTCEDPVLVRRLRVKPTRTISGVAPVTVLTEPYPCEGDCIFCPQAEGMPKSYLPDEPGAMRAASYGFDPFAQTAGRVSVMQELGHQVHKVELLILGGTWSHYPHDYQEWFIRRCLDALNGFDSASLEQAQRLNENALYRNVGLVVETRPDCVTTSEVRRLRRLGVTKVQLGAQSLDDELLDLNRRGHDVAQLRHAMRLLRLAGFKVVLHWMPNLLGATPERDLQDFDRIWTDSAIRPDELKIYPTALLAGTELYARWQEGYYVPYDEGTLVQLLTDCKALIPPYCRLNRLMRDIPAPNIVAGVKRSNLRQIVQSTLTSHGLVCRCIRCREIRGQAVDADTLELQRIEYPTDGTQEVFLSGVTEQGNLAGFARLSLPIAESPLDELKHSAVIREVHVYGEALALSTSTPGAAQHAGLGSRLLSEAHRIARAAGYGRLSVIAAVGTRPYYRERGYALGRLYMSRDL
jgi:elongator complex protein 3